VPRRGIKGRSDMADSKEGVAGALSLIWRMKNSKMTIGPLSTL